MKNRKKNSKEAWLNKIKLVLLKLHYFGTEQPIPSLGYTAPTFTCCIAP